MTTKNNLKRSGIVQKSRAAKRTKTNKTTKTNKRNVRQKSIRPVRKHSAYRNRRYMGGSIGTSVVCDEESCRKKEKCTNLGKQTNADGKVYYIYPNGTLCDINDGEEGVLVESTTYKPLRKHTDNEASLALNGKEIVDSGSSNHPSHLTPHNSHEVSPETILNKIFSAKDGVIFSTLLELANKYDDNSANISENLKPYELGKYNEKISKVEKERYRKSLRELFIGFEYDKISTNTNVLEINNKYMRITINDNLNISFFNINDDVNRNVEPSNTFPKGNMHRYEDSSVNTNIKLINLFEISFTPTSQTTPIKSLRYGTPFKSTYETDKELYKEQCDLIKQYLNSTPQPQPLKKRRGIVISLIDMCNICDTFMKDIGGEKCKETDIIMTENKEYIETINQSSLWKGILSSKGKSIFGMNSDRYFILHTNGLFERYDSLASTKLKDGKVIRYIINSTTNVELKDNSKLIIKDLAQDLDYELSGTGINDLFTHLNTVKPQITTNQTSNNDSSNIAFLNMSINNNVNWQKTSACPTSPFAKVEWDQYCRNVEYYLGILENWCNESAAGTHVAQIALTKLMTFWADFEHNVHLNKIPSSMGVYCNTIKADTIRSHNEKMPNEVCRLIMFCYISLIIYLLNARNDGCEYILMYHCKSGQDRTGTFYAINQMVNEITDKYFAEIMNDINTNNEPFQNIYNKYYNPRSTIPGNEQLANNIQLFNIIQKHMLFSYFVTYTSAGIPGIKWNLGKEPKLETIKEKITPEKIKGENRFPYLLLKDPETAKLFEGGSKLRGS